jgi:hypothetical protein
MSILKPERGQLRGCRALDSRFRDTGATNYAGRGRQLTPAVVDGAVYKVQVVNWEGSAVVSPADAQVPANQVVPPPTTDPVIFSLSTDNHS